MLVFESNLGDCSFSFNQLYNLSGMQLVQQALLKVWHTEEMADLFNWIRTTTEGENPLIISGMDIQPSSSESITSKVLVSVFSAVGKNHGALVENLERTLPIEFINSYRSRNFTREQKKTHMDLKQGYLNLLSVLEQNQSKLHMEYDQKASSLIKRIVLNRGYLLEIMTCKSFRKAIKLRNKMMASNIEWLAKDMYKEEKIIIWAHNSHISKRKQEHLE